MKHVDDAHRFIDDFRLLLMRFLHFEKDVYLWIPVLGNPMSAAAVIEHILIDHAKQHTASIKDAVRG